MAYCTKTDILNYISESELAQVTSEAGDVVDDAVIAKGIADADSLIDSYLAKVYAVPVSPTTARLTLLSSMIALYLLFSRRAPRVGMSETVQKNYDDSIRFLEQVAAGKVTVGIDPPPSSASSAGGYTSASKRIFSNESLKGL
jgi:phage gp36-like protein